MIGFITLLRLAASLAFFRMGTAQNFPGKIVRRSELLRKYDYIVVGGGISGLVVANRLTESPILVIEAGGFDKQEDFITIPLITTGNVADVGNGPRGSIYDWNLTTIPQYELKNRSIDTPAGKVVGGGSVINGMVYNRGSRVEYDRWEELGNPGWNFDALLPYFKKAETFTPPDAELAEWNIQYNPGYHGSSGFVESSFPRFVWPSTRNFINALKELSIKILADSMGGNAAGGYWFTLSLKAKDQTRSTSKCFYKPRRPNFHILTEYQVTKLLLQKQQSKIEATGVEFSKGINQTKYSLTVSREVILAAGALHTPQILQISGIGDKGHLASIGIETLMDLSGVGQNYQDHLLMVTAHTVDISVNLGNFSNSTWNTEMRTLYDRERNGPYTTASGNFVAFLPLGTFTDNTTVNSITSESSIQEPAQYLSSSIPVEVLAGYTAQHSLLTRGLKSKISAHLEFILSDAIVIPVLQQPFSRGSIHINSSSIFDSPVIDPRYCSNPLDLKLLVEGFKYSRTIRSTHALKEVKIQEVYPGTSIETYEEIEDFVRGSVESIHHHVGTASMLPREFGGVVDPTLKVYGVKGLRVVDASVIPMLPASHMQATVYAIAEKAADLIKLTYYGSSL